METHAQDRLDDRPPVLYWIATDRESRTAAPAYAPYEEVSPAACAQIGLDLRWVGVSEIVCIDSLPDGSQWWFSEIEADGGAGALDSDPHRIGLEACLDSFLPLSAEHGAQCGR